MTKDDNKTLTWSLALIVSITLVVPLANDTVLVPDVGTIDVEDNWVLASKPPFCDLFGDICCAET